MRVEIGDFRMKSNNLNTKEKELLELLWDSDVALTSVEMLEKLGSDKWNKLSVFRTINGLIKKECIVVSGLEQYNTQYARKFTYALTREEYMAKLMRNDGMGLESLGSVALALIGDEAPTSKKEKDALIDNLQAIIDDLKSQENNKTEKGK